ncbi:hypothetical protein IWX89_003695 [Cryobacterium sp. MP_M3]|nr:hypothetical protein [Cryobacterium sp. MP_M3]MBG6060221.1 hypothetical protein [Cryobacterium sp. MP_M3]
MQFTLWLATSLGFGLLAVRFHHHAIKVVLFLATAVPYVASDLVTGYSGGFLDLHPATWFALFAFIVASLIRPREVLKLIGRDPVPNFLMATVLSIVVATVVVRDGSSGLSLIANQMVVPYAVFLWARFEIRRDSRFGASLARFVVGLGAIESALALFQWATKTTLFFTTQMSTYGWYRLNVRQFGTLDHPLTLSLLLAICIPLSVNIRRAYFQVPVVVLLLIGVLLTESRTGLLLAAAGLAFLLLRKQASVKTRIAACGALGLGLILFFQSSLAEGIAARLDNDNGSANARSLALKFFFENVWHYFLGGDGVGSSFETSSNGGLATSLESPVLMYALDFGLLVTLIYFGVQLVLVLRWKRGWTATSGARAGALFAVLSIQTYSSVATESAAALLVWAVIGIATLSLTQEDNPESPNAHTRGRRIHSGQFGQKRATPGQPD